MNIINFSVQNVIKSFNNGAHGREVLIPNLQSERHYGDGEWNMCSYFHFHESIRCVNKTELRYKAGKNECKMLDQIGDQKWTGVFKDVESKDLAPMVSSIDWKDVVCVAGFLPIPEWGKTK